MRLSRFGESFTKKSGILELMEDLGRAMAKMGDKEELKMLGGWRLDRKAFKNQCHFKFS